MRDACRDIRYVVTCEHGGNSIPPRYRKLFSGRVVLLASHRGWDAGALVLARRLAKVLAAPLVASTTTRLLVDLNRSEHHRAVFSPITKALPDTTRERVLAQHYRPYRAAVTAAIDDALRECARVVHISAHSFVPVLAGEVRRADVGFLYDPRRKPEAGLCTAWARAISLELPWLKIRRNYPYRGSADGLTTSLRRVYPAAKYLGIEIELNQRLLATPDGGRAVMAAICRAVSDQSPSR